MVDPPRGRRRALTCRLPACIAREAPIVKSDAGHTRTQSERREQTRRALIAAGRELFAERGFFSAGREDIVERAGVTRGALYHHFISKEDLFRTVYEEVETELCAATMAAAATVTDPVEQLRVGSLSFLDAASQPEVRRICLLDAPSVLDGDVRRELSEKYGLGLVRGGLLAVEQAGRLEIGPVDALAPVLLAALHEAATSIADGAVPADVRAVVEGVLDAITTPA
jgi:AcrR family transcriptional regulator